MKKAHVDISVYGGLHLIRKRYASLVILFGADREDNELYILEVIHRWVVTMNDYFKDVCELDVIYNFEKCQFLLDEVLIGGELQELNKDTVVESVVVQDNSMEDNPQGRFLRLQLMN
ncbi:AP-1 complex subunit sigma-2 [Thelohanellus kitauei]|uniref:AP complex subunit sigma n=1 Tax=Thelohanellus kitauei TaxID=669202 RepID=A0A0C2MS18_THEKT|nr:AP-1 complex subunit sigma-2 [Thelohanellus kitauei]